jgi:hypothetical protein
MLDPRIYRTGLVVVLLAVIVLAFSLYDQQGPLGTTLAPDAFNGQNAFTTMTSLAAGYPNRRPGSPGDDDVAAYVANAFTGNKLIVSRDTFTARTVDGTRTLETVTGTLPGLSDGSIVVVAHRDALGSPARADLSGTATLIELSRVLSGETHHRSIVLVSTSGSVGAAGAAQLARNLPGAVDAVIVLGDLAGSRVRDPIVVPWSSGQQVAPPMLRNTVAAALGAQAQLRPGGTSLAGQFAHLAFPLSVGEQAPFGLSGYPAVLLSLAGERGPAADEQVQLPQITALGRTVLQTVSALDGGPSVPAASPYVLLSGKVIPGWAIRLFVLALMVPVLMATIDGLARARRRGHSISRWIIWVLASALPFVLALAVVLGSRLVGLIKVAPPDPVGAGVVPPHAAGIAILAVIACVLVLSFVALRPFVIRLAGGEPYARRRLSEPANPGAGASVLLVMCAVSLAIWLQNPFAAALLVPALHLWMWVVDPDVRPRAAVMAGLLVVGLAPPVLVIAYYAVTLGLSPMDVAWNGTLLLAGGYVGVLAAVEWSVVLGCVASVLAIALRQTRADRPEQAPVTVRGPVTYAGPGSLGGTESALRR